MIVVAKDLGAEVNRFKEPNFQPETCKHYPTGFKELDDFLNGGFTDGFHGISGRPSIGKTTFIQQLAENFGKTGTLVLLFSTETLAETMVASSISRASYKLDPATALSSEAVLKAVGENPDSQPPELISAIDQSVADCENVTVIDCESWEHTVEEIVDTVTEYKATHDEDVFVIVDYLQELLPAEGKHFEDRKSLVDHSVITLKNLAQKLQIPVLLVSAINRDFYNTPAGFGSLKDTGRLEYNLDTIIALEPIVSDDTNDSSERKVKLSILKQRTGASGIKVPLTYHAEYNYFEECSSVQQEPVQKPVQKLELSPELDPDLEEINPFPKDLLKNVH